MEMFSMLVSVFSPISCKCFPCWFQCSPFTHQLQQHSGLPWTQSQGRVVPLFPDPSQCCFQLGNPSRGRMWSCWGESRGSEGWNSSAGKKGWESLGCLPGEDKVWGDLIVTFQCLQGDRGRGTFQGPGVTGQRGMYSKC